MHPDEKERGHKKPLTEEKRHIHDHERKPRDDQGNSRADSDEPSPKNKKRED